MPGENQTILLAIIDDNLHMCATAQTSLFNQRDNKSLGLFNSYNHITVSNSTKLFFVEGKLALTRSKGGNITSNYSGSLIPTNSPLLIRRN
ncbi:protein of unknown function [Candidatus Nitrotoga arctica]|uniref:Uncharacterized protein n=1 Tax=Candidatus Nitrotoga arctica TaxID=453162 RepID=A0ABM8YVV3_9PROT|nr:protein of unknown function [Candidatus Nitrotoga arctica]